MYYNARAATGDERRDNGTTVRTAIKAVACYKDTVVHTIVYERITRNLDHLRACLAQGDPFVFGVQVYFGPFMEAKTSGVLVLPKRSVQPIGGHARDGSQLRFLANSQLRALGFWNDVVMVGVRRNAIVRERMLA
jgi:hypothetical protein